MFSIINLFRVASASKVDRQEEGDGLPDEVTALVLRHFSALFIISSNGDGSISYASEEVNPFNPFIPPSSDEITEKAHFSPMKWVATFPLVCRKWNRLMSMPELSENIAKTHRVIFNFKPKEGVTIEFKKHICFLLPAKTKEELINKVKMICALKNPQEIVGIHYTSARNPRAYLIAFTIKDRSSRSFNELRQQATHIYYIQGEEEADFGLERKGPSETYSLSIGNIDIMHTSVQQESRIIAKAMKDALTPKLSGLSHFFF